MLFKNFRPKNFRFLRKTFGFCQKLSAFLKKTFLGHDEKLSAFFLVATKIINFRSFKDYMAMYRSVHRSIHRSKNFREKKSRFWAMFKNFRFLLKTFGFCQKLSAFFEKPWPKVFEPHCNVFTNVIR